jgi:flagellar biosynthetic protein FlhB
MSEQQDKDQKQFEPSARRKQEYRKDGKVAVSRDLAATAQLVAILLGFSLLGGTLLTGLASALGWVLSHAGDVDMTLGMALKAHFDALALPFLALAMLFLATTLVAYFAQTGGMFSAKAIGFKLDRLKPLKRLMDLFGPKKISVTVMLNLGKVGLTGFILALALSEVMPQISNLGMSDLATAEELTRSELRRLLFITIMVLAILATIDFIWQKRQLHTEMKMTRDELKRESEDEDGRPEFKSHRRRKHRELSMNRILDAVPGADVIVTNPTHFAVALQYSPGKHAAPVVVAKGIDDMALTIRKLARRHAVPIIEDRPLARTLWATVKVGKPVPSHLFQQVAAVLAKVFKSRQKVESAPGTLGR